MERPGGWDDYAKGKVGRRFCVAVPGHRRLAEMLAHSQIFGEDACASESLLHEISVRTL